MKQVKVAPGYSAVPINGKVYNQGQLITLTDQQYAALPQFVRNQLMGVWFDQSPSAAPDPVPTPDQPTTSSYTDQLINSELAKVGVPSVLRWDGLDYQPSFMKDRTDRPRTFIGPQDPSITNGVALTPRDQWINY